MRLLGEVQRGALQLETFSKSDMRAAVAIIERHEGLAISLADASIVVLATRHNIQDVLTLDQRHFRAVRRNRGLDRKPKSPAQLRSTKRHRLR